MRRGRPKKAGVRVHGPYKHGRKWRLMVYEGSTRVTRSFSTEEEAKQTAIAVRRLTIDAVLTCDALRKYETFMREKGNRESSISTVMIHLNRWLDSDTVLNVYDREKLECIYKMRCEEVAVDTHHRELGDVKIFYRWAVKNRLVKTSPAQEINSVGRRNSRKPQLRRGEAQQFVAVATEEAQQGVDSALALLTILLLGLRSSELLNRKVRDLDICNDGVLLWIENGKTKNATRFCNVPPLLADLLVAYVQGKGKEERLFGRSKKWLLYHTARICKKAGVPIIPTHGLRGTWATLAVELGIETNAVARALGHGSFATTKKHYALPGAEDRARTTTILQLVNSGNEIHEFQSQNGKVGQNGQ